MAYVITEDCVAYGSCAAECPSDAIKGAISMLSPISALNAVLA